MGHCPREGQEPMSVFKNRDAEARERLGRDAIEAAYAAPDAELVIETGFWKGFTKAAARAWCWNLFQFEPYGFIIPASFATSRQQQELESGLIPENELYAKRARDFVLFGQSPLQYRENRLAMSSPTFCWADVRFVAEKGS